MVGGASFFGMQSLNTGRRQRRQKPGIYDNAPAQKLYACPEPDCDKAFLNNRHLRRHQNIKHGRIPTRRTKTNIFDPIYSSMGGLASGEDGGQIAGRPSSQNIANFDIDDLYNRDSLQK